MRSKPKPYPPGDPPMEFFSRETEYSNMTLNNLGVLKGYKIHKYMTS